MDSSQVVLLSERPIAELHQAEHFDDPVFGLVQKITYREEGVQQLINAVLWHPDFENIGRADLFRLFGSAEQDPASGYAPKLLGYVRKHTSKGNFTAGDAQDSSLDSVVELILDLSTETLKKTIEKRGSNQTQYSEAEIRATIESICESLQNFARLGVQDPKLALERIIVSEQNHKCYLYHPWLSDASITQYEIIRGDSPRTNKHYYSPEEVDLAFESANSEEFENLIAELGDKTGFWVFSLGLIVLEMSSLIQEDAWYDEQGVFKSDIQELKLSVFRNQYSADLADLVSKMIEPMSRRVHISDILLSLNKRSNIVGNKTALFVDSKALLHPNPPFRQMRQQVPNELQPLQSKPIQAAQDSAEKRENFMFSSKKQPFNTISYSSADDKFNMISQIGASNSKPSPHLVDRQFQPLQSVGGELSFGLYGGKNYMSSTSQSISQSSDAQKSVSAQLSAPAARLLPPPPLVPHTTHTSPTRLAQPAAPAPPQPPVSRLDIPSPHPSPQPLPGRSLSPRVVSVTKYLVKDGQRTLISREEYPQDKTVNATTNTIYSTNAPVQQQQVLSMQRGAGYGCESVLQPVLLSAVSVAPVQTVNRTGELRPVAAPVKEASQYQSTSEEFARKFQEVQTILDNLIATREQGVSRGIQVGSPLAQNQTNAGNLGREGYNALQRAVRSHFMEDKQDIHATNTVRRDRDSHVDELDQVSGIHELLGDEFEQSDPEYEAKPNSDFLDAPNYRQQLNSNLDFGEYPATLELENNNRKPRIQPLERVVSHYCCRDCKQIDERIGKSGIATHGSCQKHKQLTPSTTIMGSDKGSGSQITRHRLQKPARPISPRAALAYTNRDSSSVSRSRSQRTKSSKSRSTSIGPLQRGAKKISNPAALRQPNLILEDFCPRYLREITPPKRLQPLPQNELFLQTQILRMLKQRDLKTLKSELLTTSRPVSREPQHPKRIHARTDRK